MSEVTVVEQVMITPAWGALLLAAFGLTLVLILIGLRNRNPVLTGAGLLIAGALVLATDFVIFLRTPPPSPEGYRLTTSDILLVGMLGFLGGALSMLGSSYLSITRRSGTAPGAR